MKPDSKSAGLFRIRLVSWACMLVTLVLLVRLYDVQIVRGNTYREKADRQYQAPAGLVFNRGSIYFQDRTGNLVSAATLQNGATLAINPRRMTDPARAYEAVNAIMPTDQKSFLDKAAKHDDPYEEIAKRLPADTASAIDALNVPGVILEKEKWRYYPGEELAAHVLGFVGFDGNQLNGRYGVERYYNDVLARPENTAYTNFFAQIFGDFTDSEKRKELTEGDVILTIEPAAQDFLEQILEEIASARTADQVGGIIINPMNGEIAAMGLVPTYNPNTFSEEKNVHVFTDSLVENVFEMGSIIKPLTMAAGIDSGAVTPYTTYYDAGFLVLNGKRIENYDGRGRGTTDMQHVLNESLNTGVSFVVSQMGNKKFADYMRAYGVGEETGIDLPNETVGLISNLNSTRDVEYATASFGQGIAFTPIATVRALSTLGNGGVLVTPHVARRINYNFGVSKDVSYPEGKRVIKQATSEEITRMLVKVVDEALLGGTVKLPNYSVAAKTGTAQIAKPGGGGYYEDRYLHSFFGYFPAYQPKFLVFFYAVNPHGTRYASETFTDPFMRTVKFLINYYQIPPDR